MRLPSPSIPPRRPRCAADSNARRSRLVGAGFKPAPLPFRRQNESRGVRGGRGGRETALTFLRALRVKSSCGGDEGGGLETRRYERSFIWRPILSCADTDKLTSHAPSSVRRRRLRSSRAR